MSSQEPHEPPRGEATEPRWLMYKSGGTDCGNFTIENIVYLSKRGAVYIAKGENLRWDEEDGLGEHWSRATTEAINLLTLVKVNLGDPLDRSRALRMLAAGLGRALEKKAEEPDRDFLADARKFIVARQVEVLQIRYFMTAVVTVVVTTIAGLALIAAPLSPSAAEFALSVLLGGLGAILSVSQRFRSILIEPYTTRRFIMIGGCSRIIIGCMFGAVFLLFQKAGLLLSIAEGHPFLLAAAAFVAGFSERAIPEMLEKFEPQISLSSASKT